MSTRSRIGMTNDDGSITSIYCHNDGYIEAPHGVGFKLFKHFTTAPIVKLMISFGNRSSLSPPGEGAEAAAFGTVYGMSGPMADRSRVPPIISDREMFWRELNEEYTYLFENGKWWVCDHNSPKAELVVACCTSELER